MIVVCSVEEGTRMGQSNGVVGGKEGWIWEGTSFLNGGRALTPVDTSSISSGDTPSAAGTP